MNIKFLSVVSALLLALAVAPSAVLADNTFSGQATVVQANVLGFQPITLGDTGPLPPQGGSQDASLLSASVPGLLSLQVVHAATVAMGNASRAEASVADLKLTVNGNTIGADFLMARAGAFCDLSGAATASGSSELAALVINGNAIVVTGQPNQTIPLPGGGAVIINEQSQSVQGNKADITVTALHVVIPLGVGDVAVSRAHADIQCGGTGGGTGGGIGGGTGGGGGNVCPTDKDFVTGGGFIMVNGSKETFGVGGGIKSGAFWGHLTYVDHGTGMKVKGTGVTAYNITGLTSRHIEGTCEINGVSGTYKVDVADNGEPGRGVDTFAIVLSDGYNAGGTLAGGNIQLHTCK